MPERSQSPQLSPPLNHGGGAWAIQWWQRWLAQSHPGLPSNTLIELLVRTSWLAALLPAGFFLIHAFYYLVWGVDDPFISYRYARHLADGHGMVFNFGERVEGYSNFLYVIILAATYKVGFAPESISPWLGILASFCVITFVALKGAAAQQGIIKSRLAAWALAFSAPFAYWAPAGLETPVYMAFIFFGVWWAGCALHKPQQVNRCWYWAWTCLTLAALTRIEGPMVCIPVGIFGLLAWNRYHPTVRRRFLTGVVVSFLVQVLYHAWRLWYFRALFPNTFTAKATGNLSGRLEAGGEYLIKALVFDSLLVTALGMFAAILYLTRKKPGDDIPEPSGSPDESYVERPLCPHLPLFLSVIGLQLIFMVYVGGDWMHFSRFYLPVLPLAAVVAQDGLLRAFQLLKNRDPRHLKRDALALLCVVLLGVGLVTERLQGGPMMRAIGEHRIVSPMLYLADLLKSTADRPMTLAGEEAGYLPYFTDFRFFDMLGIVTPAVAAMPGGLHEKTNAPWILDQEPDFIVLIAVPHDTTPHPPKEALFTGSKAMLAEERFFEEYEYVMYVRRGNKYFAHADILLYQRRNDAPLRGTPLDPID